MICSGRQSTDLKQLDDVIEEVSQCMRAQIKYVHDFHNKMNVEVAPGVCVAPGDKVNVEVAPNSRKIALKSQYPRAFHDQALFGIESHV